jgi:hypothetical protein
MTTIGSIYLGSPTPRWLQESEERTTSYGSVIPAAVTVHHAASVGVSVSLTFANREALAAYARQLLELSEVAS